MSRNPMSKVLIMTAAAIFLSSGTAMAADAWPDLPVGIKNGVAVRVGDTAYVGLGSAGTDFYALDLTNPASGWAKRAAFAGPATNGAAAAVSGGRVFIFSGNGKASADAKSSVIFDTVYSYDTIADVWAKVETVTPVGLSGARALSLKDGRIAIVGGYNKELFDKYLADVAATDKEKNPEGYKKLVDGYMGMKPTDYRWNAKVLSYDPGANSWSSLGDNPFLPNCDPAVVALGGDVFTVISGEIKPGLRTPEVKQVKVDGHSASWQKLADLPRPVANSRQEGVAGAFAGEVGGAILIAGGANFVGAQANAEAGKWFAHEGLKKGWRDEIYAFDGTAWQEVGKLPTGLGYGASFSVPGGMLVVGGEDSEAKARNEAFLVRWDSRALSIEN